MKTDSKSTAQRRHIDLKFVALAAAVMVIGRFPAYAAVPPQSDNPAGTVVADEAIPNLDLAQGLTHWQQTALGSNKVTHPYYDIGVDKTVTLEGRPSGFVRSKGRDPHANGGDWGTLRYDLPVDAVARYRGKRLRFSGFVQAHDLRRRALLYIGTETSRLDLNATSPDVTNDSEAAKRPSAWEYVECVADVPVDARTVMFGMSLEGKGTVYGNHFRLQVVDRSTPLTTFTARQFDEDVPDFDAHNLTFKYAIYGWWNDNPGHTAEDDYSMRFASTDGRHYGKAALLQNIVPNPRSYGTVAQNAKPGQYLGKRIRFSAWMKTEDADKAGLWIVVHDPAPGHSNYINEDWNGKTLRGTNDWTKVVYEIDVPSTATGISFGIDSTGKGKVWVDEFDFEILGPSQI